MSGRVGRADRIVVGGKGNVRKQKAVASTVRFGLKSGNDDGCGYDRCSR